MLRLFGTCKGIIEEEGKNVRIKDVKGERI